MKNVATFIEIENAANHLWVTSKEIAVILGNASLTKTNKFIAELQEKLQKEKLEAMKIENENERIKKVAYCFYYEDCKPKRYPIRRVLEHAYVDINYVHKEAEKMRKALKGEENHEKENKIKT